jgi:glycine betaine/proline transport system substrate-binding protein
MNTVTLVIISSLVSIIIGVPLGILMAKSEKAQSIITPVLDFMQTMPGFVYLIPAVAFFGIGMVPGVFASVIFALPPTVRMTNLGIRQVPTELVEASDSFGGTGKQKLFKLELPLAKSTIFAGINQTIMLALSMVVIASMIGAPGLGQGVLSAVQRSQVGSGFVNGLALVVLAIIMDRFTQNMNRPKSNKEPKTAKQKKVITGSIIAAIIVLVGGTVISSMLGDKKETVNLAYVEWDTEVASTTVVSEVLRDMGYEVNMTPLDNAIMWEAVANGEADGMVAAWLPGTHGTQYEKFKDKVENLGPNLEGGARLGIVVPSYMDVDSIEDLSDQANKTIVGIEPGAGVVSAAEKTVEEYPNLSDWNLMTSSGGAMTTELANAVKNEKEIVITGWSPHWMFSRYDLKYLEDPKGTMGGEESIHTMVRHGLKEDMPEVYNVLDNFSWELEDIEGMMLEIENGTDPVQAARDWMDANEETVNSWKQ